MKCNVPECGNLGTVRGLCQTHYNGAVRLIKKGLTSWERLEAEGKVLKAGTGRKPQELGAASKWLLGGGVGPVQGSQKAKEAPEAVEAPLEMEPGEERF